MMINTQTLSFFSKVKRQARTILVIWTVATLISLGWNIYSHQRMIRETAHFTAQTAFEKDLLYRKWIAFHGGVYLAVNDDSIPNPYLANNPQRDFTVGGKEYTLINPAYMTRQVFDLQPESPLAEGHITSLNPLNEANMPYWYEVEALAAFENGEEEYVKQIELENEAVLFYMHALIVEESCLVCHEKQGYEVGDVRGGISEVVRLSEYQSIFQPQMNNIIIGHILFYLLGLFCLGAVYYYLRNDAKTQLNHEKELLRMGYYDPLTGLFSRSFFEEYRKENRDRFLIPIKIVYFDVDDLKLVNDQFGHQEGDVLLQRAADVIRKTFRDDDIKVRLSGDEFVVLLIHTEITTEKIHRRLQNYIQENNQVHTGKPALSLSIGVSDVIGFQKLQKGLKDADTAMYAEKQQKKAARAV